MNLLKNALLGGLVVGSALVVLLLLANPFGGGTPEGSFTPVAPNLVPDPALVSGRGMGVTDAPVVLEVWTDYQCPICGAWANGVEARLYDRYITEGKLRIEHHHFAFLGEESFTAAVAASCAERQGSFWAYHSLLFANQSGENQGAFSDAHLRILAATAGLDLAAYDTCIADPAVRANVEAESAAAADLGINSTPTLKVGDWVQAGIPSDSDLNARIDAALGQ